MAASTSLTSPLRKKMSGRRAKTSGWAAFDLNERLKQQGLEPEPLTETFPHVSVPATSLSGPSQSIAKNSGAILEKPFSSLLLPSVSFPSLMANKRSDANQIQVGDSCFNQSDGFIQEKGFLEVCQKLKEIHPWADDTLITDVMAGVNDFNRALALLEAMVSPDHTYIAPHNRKTKGFDIDKFLTPEAADTPCIQKFKVVDTDIKGVKSSNKDSLTNISNFAANKGVSLSQERGFLEVCQKLKEIHPWADDTLITDVMAGVNDFNRALTLLGAMVSPDHTYVAHHNRKTKGFDIDKFLTPEEADTPCIQKFKEVDTDIKGVKSSNKDSLTNISIFAANKGVSLSQERGFLEMCQKLKDIHPWADDTLITDVMAGVNDFNRALALLEALVSPDHTYVAHHNRKTKGFDIDKFLTPEEADTPCIQKFKEVDTDIKGVESSNKDSLTNISIFAANKGVSLSQERDFLEVCQNLKEIHPWADDTLITDVMAGVNDFNRALTLLEAMVSPDHTYVAHHNRKTKGFDIDKFLTPEEADTPCIQKFKEVDTDTKGVKSSNEDSLTNISNFAANKGVSLTDNVNLDELSHALAMCLRINSQELINNCVSRENKLHYDGAVGSMRFVPVEPEWEEDDIYSIHRKDAVKMTRSAAQHSKAAREAYLRGDHLSAQYFSLKAREEWVAANRLNAQAAKEILTAHNGKNDQWTLDLHGLHAKEAVQAVQEHLQKIEAQVTQNLAAHMNQVNFKPGFRGAVSVESSGRIDVENESKGSPLNKQRPAFLEVITGKGIHSRGQPALPIFIRSFLEENGYHYEETRPGVISVMPKFRP